MLAAGALHLGAQSWRASFRYPADPRNPYVYAQTSPDFLRLVQRIADVSALHPDGRTCSSRWSPARTSNGRCRGTCGAWTVSATGRTPPRQRRSIVAPVIIASQEQAAPIDRALGDRYVSEFYGLRPDVLLTLYIDRTLWARFLQR